MENQQEPQGAEQLTEPQATEPTAEPNKQEPHGETVQAQQIDWKAEARKWEKRAKESNAKLQGSSDLEDRLGAVEERAQKAEKEAADLKHKSDMLEGAAEFAVPRGCGRTPRSSRSTSETCRSIQWLRAAASLHRQPLPFQYPESSNNNKEAKHGTYRVP